MTFKVLFQIVIVPSEEEIKLLDTSCQKVLEMPKIRFVGVLNYMGNKIAGGFKNRITSYLLDKEDRMLYIQITLEYLMRKDFDIKLGPIDYIVSRREKIIMLSIPILDYLVFISAERNANVDKIIDVVNKSFTMLPDIKP